jgi:predicted secreted Zn-dependent protease
MTLVRTCLLAAVVGLAFAASAAAAHRGVFETRTFAEPAKPGLAVSGALNGYRATSVGRVIVPTSWRRLAAPAGRLRFLTVNNPSCRYTVSYTVKSVLAPSQDASSYVTAGLPSPSARHLLDSGARGNRAFRVVRQTGIGGRVRLEALWAGVLTKRSDIAPAGQAAWTEIRVTAVSGAGDECHSGTWRQALGPTIGDSLAVARTSLRFTKSA